MYTTFVSFILFHVSLSTDLIGPKEIKKKTTTKNNNNVLWIGIRGNLYGRNTIQRRVITRNDPTENKKNNA